MSKTELNWALECRHRGEFYQGYVVRCIAELAQAEERVTFAERGVGPVPGVRVLATPGHSPGHLAFEVEASDGLRRIFAGDAVKNRVELQEGKPARAVDATVGADSVVMLKRRMMLSGACMYPGHDAEVLLTAGGRVGVGREEAFDLEILNGCAGDGC